MLTQGSLGKGVAEKKYHEWFIREMYMNALLWPPFYKKTSLIIISTWSTPHDDFGVHKSMFLRSRNLMVPFIFTFPKLQFGPYLGYYWHMLTQSIVGKGL